MHERLVNAAATNSEVYLYTLRKQENQQEAEAVRKMVIRKLPVRLL